MMNNIMDTTKIKDRILYLLRNKQCDASFSGILYFGNESIMSCSKDSFGYSINKDDKLVINITGIKFTESELKEVEYLWDKRYQELIDNLVFDE